MIDTTSFMLGNLQSIFLPKKQKDFISNTKKHTAKINTHQSQSLLSFFTLFNNHLYVDTLI